jgi:CubicO group peptidase (beta-lactamase class C family)
MERTTVSRSKAIALYSFLILPGSASPTAAAEVCPGATWERIAPKDAGWSAGRLKKADAIAKELDTDSYLIVSGGRVVWEYGDPTLASNVHSVRKSIASILFGTASDRKQMTLDRTLADLGIDDTQGLSPTEKTANIRQLLSARSCIYHKAAYETKEQVGRRPERHSCRPGERWFYNNWDFNALGTIYQAVTGRTLFDAFESEIAGPLQLEHFRKADHTSFHREDVSHHPAYLFRLSALDMARIGLLMARGGEWCGRRIVSTGWVEESTVKISDTNRKTGYGYLWWVGDDGRQLGAEFKGKAFSARGARGQFMIVNPTDDLIIVHRVDTDVKGQRVSPKDFEELAQAIVAARR